MNHLNEIAKQVYPLFMQPAEAAEGISKKREALNIMKHRTIMTLLLGSKEARNEQLRDHDKEIERLCNDVLPKERIKIVKSSIVISGAEMYITTTIVVP